MKKHFWNFVFMAVLPIMLVSCKRNNDEQVNLENNSNIIEKKILTQLVKEALVLEASLYFLSNKGSDMSTITTVYYNQLFEKYDTDREQFFRSVKYYVQNGDENQNFFVEVVNMLTVEADSIRKETATSTFDTTEPTQVEKIDTNHKIGIFRKIKG